jgi:methionyl-tRNA synthetase
LDLPSLGDRIRDWVGSASSQGGWSANARQVTAAWLRDQASLQIAAENSKIRKIVKRNDKLNLEERSHDGSKFDLVKKERHFILKGLPGAADLEFVVEHSCDRTYLKTVNGDYVTLDVATGAIVTTSSPSLEVDIQGLKPRCITRDLKWGVPVPGDTVQGYEDKVFYVWFDAPIGYISITADYTPEWKRWWQAPQDVELVQFLGKDNIPFHTVIFPASLLATGEPWTLLNRISVTEYLNYEDGKFSKSRGVGVFGNDACDIDIPADVWRYYLLSVRPENSDAEFRWSDLVARNNSELLSNLGNFCHRVLDFVFKRLDGTVPEISPCGAGLDDCALLGEQLSVAVNSYIENLEAARLREALKAALTVSTLGNAFLSKSEPWKTIKADPALARTHLAAAIGVVRLLAALFAPFTPSVARLYLHYLGLDSQQGHLTDELLASVKAPHTLVPAGHQLPCKPRAVFSKIDASKVAEWRKRFGGGQDHEVASTASTASQ